MYKKYNKQELIELHLRLKIKNAKDEFNADTCPSFAPHQRKLFFYLL